MNNKLLRDCSKYCKFESCIPEICNVSDEELNHFYVKFKRRFITKSFLHSSSLSMNSFAENI